MVFHPAGWIECFFVLSLPSGQTASQPLESFLLKADPGNSHGATGLSVDSDISHVGNVPGLL